MDSNQKKKINYAGIIKAFFDYSLFLASAFVIGAIIIGVKDANWVTMGCALLAGFWMFVSQGLRGALKASEEGRAILAKAVANFLKIQNENEEKVEKEKKTE